MATVRQLLPLMRELRLRRTGDVLARVSRAAQARSGLMRWRHAIAGHGETAFLAQLDRREWPTLDAFSRHFDERAAPRFYFDADQIKEPDIASEAFRRAAIEAADRAAARRFSYCGSSEREFAAEVNWHHALLTDETWPKEPWWSIRYKALGYKGDIKACWELNRHQFFANLGLTYVMTGDERYPATVAEFLTSWCRQNPPGIGIHWLSNMELGLRCLAWLWTHHLIRGSSSYPLAARNLLHLNVFHMAGHIARNIRYTARTGRTNHLVADAACLTIVASLYPELRASARWKRLGLRLLWRALEAQVLPDGMHYEISCGYHALVMELVWQVVLLLRRHGETVPQTAMDKLEAMTGALLALAMPDRSLPKLNDSDDGFALPIVQDPARRTEVLVALGAAVFDRPDWKALMSPPDPIWALLAPDVSARYEQLGSAVPARACAALPNAGLYVMRSDWGPNASYALIDNHADPFPDSGHGHASLLHFLLCLGGRHILIDCGTYRYNAGGGYRNALRATHAHNTVVVDGVGQAQPIRDFGWLSLLVPVCSRWRCSDDYAVFDGAHDSYRRLRQRVRHRRTVLWLKRHGCWIVRDELSGQGWHRFEQFWHFAPELTVESSGHGAFEVADGDGRQLFVEFADAARSDGFDDPADDSEEKWRWCSRDYGHREPHAVLRHSWEDRTPTVRTTVLRDARIDTAGQISVPPDGGPIRWEFPDTAGSLECLADDVRIGSA